jgi:hypothetical protein
VVVVSEKFMTKDTILFLITLPVMVVIVILSFIRFGAKFG